MVLEGTPSLRGRIAYLRRDLKVGQKVLLTAHSSPFQATVLTGPTHKEPLFLS